VIILKNNVYIFEQLVLRLSYDPTIDVVSCKKIDQSQSNVKRIID